MNRSTRVTFFNPHKDGNGCATPKPAELTLTLHALDGATITIDSACDWICRACPTATVRIVGPTLQYDWGYIAIGLGPIMLGGHRQNNYRGISFKEPTE